MANPSTRKKHSEGVVALARNQLPFDLWRPIFQDVFVTENSISHPLSDFDFSPLHSRLNVYRNLAAVSKSWRLNALDVFYEELQAHTEEALKGIVKTFQSDPHLALAVSRISFNFFEFRCSASRPRRPRPLRADSEPESSSSSDPQKLPDWKTIHRRDARSYQPSSVSQGSQWRRWQSDTALVLSMCSSLSEVDITFTSTELGRFRVTSRDYRTFFAPPDLTNDSIISGLLCSPNLRKLRLVDPTPLEQYGPALASWTRLTDLSITLTRPFDDLKNTAFIPPKSLTSFLFHDRSGAAIPWPLASDLGRCTNLQVLDLGVVMLSNEQTSKAIAFLCAAYQNSLRELTLDLYASRGGETSIDYGFSLLLKADPPLYFPRLERLRLLGESCDTSLFRSFKAESLTYLQVGWIALEPFPGTREEKWSRGLGYPSLGKLRHLVIDRDDPDRLRKEALRVVCERLDIQLEFGRSPY